MTDLIYIDPEILTKTAGEVRTINDSMYETLAQIKKNMNDLNSSYDSESGREIIAAMNAMQGRFDDYKAVVDSYATFLDQTADSFRSNEQALTSNASEFK